MMLQLVEVAPMVTRRAIIRTVDRIRTVKGSEAIAFDAKETRGRQTKWTAATAPIAATRGTRQSVIFERASLSVPPSKRHHHSTNMADEKVRLLNRVMLLVTHPSLTRAY